MPASLTVPPIVARRFVRRVQAVDERQPDVAAALDHFGYIQIDPLNICGRMHDLILRNRVAGYAEGDLHRFIHSTGRPGFEHYLPGSGVLVAFPIAAWPVLSTLIRARKLRSGIHARKLGPNAQKLAERILAELAARGPLTSDAIEHEGSSMTAWGTPGRAVKNVLEHLFIHGRVLITRRQNFRRVYDLAERVLPPAQLEAPPVSTAEIRRWIARTKLRQRRLAPLKRDELKAVADDVQPVHVEGCPPLFCLREDVPVLEALRDRSKPEDSDRRRAPPSLRSRAGLPTGMGEEPSSGPLLLAPLDPIIYDRRLTAALWNYDYTWEAYTPIHKRVRGHYSLPVLVGTEIVGHVDPKADRSSGRLVLTAKSIRRGYQVADAVHDLADWLGLK